MQVVPRIPLGGLSVAAPEPQGTTPSSPIQADGAGGAFLSLDDPALLDFLRLGHVSSSGISVSAEKAMRNAAVFRSVSLISQSIGMLPLHVVNKATKEKERDHPLFKILHRKPNAWQTAYDFRTLMQHRALVKGDGYARIVRSRDIRSRQRKIIGLVPLDPDKIDPIQNSDFTVSYRYRPSKGSQTTFDPDDVFHLRSMSADGIRGMSLVRQAADVIGLAIAADLALGRLYRNGSFVNGFLQHPKTMSAEAQERLRYQFDSRFTGAENAGKTPIFEEGLEYKLLGATARDSQSNETRGRQLEEIGRIFGIPRPLLMIDETCLPAGSKVFTTCGPKNVEDVQVGEAVWSFDGHGFIRQRVHRSEMTGIHPILTIKSRSRTLRCTGNHKVIVRRRFLLDGRVKWQNVWVRAEEITDQDYLLLPLGLPTERAVAPNGRPLTVEFMEFCGIYLAEGSTDNRSILIARHRDAPYMDAYRKAMIASFVQRDPADYSNVRPIALQEMERATRFTSKSACDEILALGLGGTAHTKRVPGWVFECAHELQAAFLRGYLDGDGHVDADGWITWSSCNRDMLEDIRHLSIGLGVPCGTVRRYESSGACTVNGRSFTRGEMYQAWGYAAPLNAGVIGSHDPRYIERWATSPSPRGVSRWSPEYKGRGVGTNRPGHDFDLPNVRLDRVVSVETSKIAQPVYDIGVENTHTFIADGVVVHNSWGSGIDVLGQFFVRYGLNPWFEAWQQAAERSLLTDDEAEELEIKFNPGALLRGSMKDQGEFFAKALGSGGHQPWMTPNEVRDVLDMPAAEDGNRLGNPMMGHNGGPPINDNGASSNG